MLLSILALIGIAVLAIVCAMLGTYCKWVFFGGPPKLGTTRATMVLLCLFGLSVGAAASTDGITAALAGALSAFLAGLLA